MYASDLSMLASQARWCGKANHPTLRKHKEQFLSLFWFHHTNILKRIHLPLLAKPLQGRPNTRIPNEICPVLSTRFKALAAFFSLNYAAIFVAACAHSMAFIGGRDLGCLYCWGVTRVLVFRETTYSWRSISSQLVFGKSYKSDTVIGLVW